jgi:hypothetical protein
VTVSYKLRTVTACLTHNGLIFGVGYSAPAARVLARSSIACSCLLDPLFDILLARGIYNPTNPLHVRVKLKRQEVNLLDRRAMVCFFTFPCANSVSQMLTTLSNIDLMKKYLNMHISLVEKAKNHTGKIHCFIVHCDTLSDSDEGEVTKPQCILQTFLLVYGP